MCTVTFVPGSQGTVFLTSSRDEQPHRQPQSQAAWHTMANGSRLYYPTDSGAGGTWMAAKQNGDVLVLLNGAFEKHEPLPPYRRSRGLVLLDLFQQADVLAAFDAYALHKIEPFTLVLWQQAQLHELRWDGTLKYHAALPASQPYLWSSATLYNAEMRALRQHWFAQWCQQQKTAANWQAIWQFHLHGGATDAAVNIRMKRPGGIETISISSICQQAGVCRFRFADLLSGEPAYTTCWQMLQPTTIL